MGGLDANRSEVEGFEGPFRGFGYSGLAQPAIGSPISICCWRSHFRGFCVLECAGAELHSGKCSIRHLILVS